MPSMNRLVGWVSLRIFHPYANLSPLSGLLNLECFRSWVAGERRIALNGVPLDGHYRDSYWCSRLRVSDEGFVSHISEILRVIGERKLDLDLLLSGNGRIEIYIQLNGKENFGEIMQSRFLRLLVLYQVEVQFEVFPDMNG